MNLKVKVYPMGANQKKVHQKRVQKRVSLKIVNLKRVKKKKFHKKNQNNFLKKIRKVKKIRRDDKLNNII